LSVNISALMRSPSNVLASFRR